MTERWRVRFTYDLEVEADSAAAAMRKARDAPPGASTTSGVSAHRILPELELRRWRGRLLDAAEALELAGEPDKAEAVRAALREGGPMPPALPPAESPETD